MKKIRKIKSTLRKAKKVKSVYTKNRILILVLLGLGAACYNYFGAGDGGRNPEPGHGYEKDVSRDGVARDLDVVTTEHTVYDITADAERAERPAGDAGFNSISYSVAVDGLAAENYTGQPYSVVNDNKPYFTDSELNPVSFEQYSELDSLGRCGVAVACIGQDIMPTEDRGQIGQVKPTGWHTVKYNDLIDGNYLYNRCHLIAFCLAGENANEKNLITGTRYLNVDGMLPFELQVARYVESTGNHVLYRVTPIFKGDNLVCEGVLMEAQSVEDNEISFCVFCYNVQPGITIDYVTGESSEK